MNSTRYDTYCTRYPDEFRHQVASGDGQEGAGASHRFIATGWTSASPPPSHHVYPHTVSRTYCPGVLLCSPVTTYELVFFFLVRLGRHHRRDAGGRGSTARLLLPRPDQPDAYLLRRPPACYYVLVVVESSFLHSSRGAGRSRWRSHRSGLGARGRPRRRGVRSGPSASGPARPPPRA
jgi:hypothetical protein